jgi:molybdopterin molybdotransferase
MTRPRQFQRRGAAEGFAWADRWRPPQAIERVALAAAAGRLLATDLSASYDLPEWTQAAVDGYALRAADTLGAGDYNPLPLRLHASGSPLASGGACPVLDGEALPAGADAVLPLDQAELSGTLLEVTRTLASGEGVALAGGECRAGERLLAAGRRLRAQDLGRLALAGLAEVPVHASPQVLLLLAGRFTRDANGPMLASLVGRDGGRLRGIEVVAEEPRLTDALRRGDTDLFLVAGGTGFAASDCAARALAAVGTVEIDGLAIHPGETTALGQVGDRPVVLLPGAPLACLCAYELIAARALRRMTGRPGAVPYREATLTLTRKLVSRIGRTELARLRIAGATAEPLATAEGRLLATAVQADGFLLVPEHSEGYAAGSPIRAYLFDDYD